MISPGAGIPVNTLKSGEAVFSLVGEHAPQVVFLVRESTAVIKYFGTTGVEVRAGLLPVGQVPVVTVAFRVGQYYGREYATWWNYHQQGGNDMFKAMVEQEFLSFHFYGDNGRKDRTFITVNPLAQFFTSAMDSILSLPGWSEEEFLAARFKILSSFPTPQALWDFLPPGHG